MERVLLGIFQSSGNSFHAYKPEKCDNLKTLTQQLVKGRFVKQRQAMFVSSNFVARSRNVYTRLLSNYPIPFHSNRMLA